MTLSQSDILRKLQELRTEHRDLDEVIHMLVETRTPDELRVKRLKKRKLRLKDYIRCLEDMLIPDIDA